MPNVSLGRITVTVPGTPVRLTANQATPGASILVHALMIQPHPANVGKVYIGITSGFNKNGSGQIAWLPAPTANSAPAFSETVSYAQNAVEANEIWIDADNANDSVIGSGIVS